MNSAQTFRSGVRTRGEDQESILREMDLGEGSEGREMSPGVSGMEGTEGPPREVEIDTGRGVRPEYPRFNEPLPSSQH